MQLNIGVRHQTVHHVSENSVGLTLTRDEALVLVEFFARFEETDGLAFAHAAEFLALSRIAAQLGKALVEPFDGRYVELLAAARERLADGHDGDYPGPKVAETRSNFGSGGAGSAT